MTDTQRLRGLMARAHERLGGVSIERMEGDNLSILLCGHFDNPDQDDRDEYGWTPDGLAGCDETLKAIGAHYSEAIGEILTAAEQAETLAGERDAYRSEAEQHFQRALENGQAAQVARAECDRLREALDGYDAERVEAIIAGLREFKPHPEAIDAINLLHKVSALVDLAARAAIDEGRS